MSLPDTQPFEQALLDAYNSFQVVLQQCTLPRSEISLPSGLPALMFHLFMLFSFFYDTLCRLNTEQQMTALVAKKDTIPLNIPPEVLSFVLLFQFFLSSFHNSQIDNNLNPNFYTLKQVEALLTPLLTVHTKLSSFFVCKPCSFYVFYFRLLRCSKKHSQRKRE